MNHEGAAVPVGDPASREDLPAPPASTSIVPPSSSWRRGLLVPSSARRRRPSDVVRLVGAVFLLSVLSLVTRTRGTLESNFGTFAASLPAWLGEIFRVLYSFGTVLVGIGLVVLVVVLRRWRLAGALLLTTVIATVCAALLYLRLDSGATVPPGGFEDLRSYPLRRLAVVVAVFFTARPYLVRPARRFFDVLVGVSVLGALMLPAALPLDVAAGFLVGWAAASATALILGSPAGRPTEAEVRDALAELGVLVSNVELAERQAWGDVRYVALDTDGQPLDIVVFGRDADDAQLLAKTWRTIWYRDTGPLLTLSRQHRVEQLAYMLLLARQRGASVAEVVVAGVGGPTKTAVVATRRPAGSSLAPRREEHVGDDPAMRVSDAALGELWRSLLALRAARIAHDGLEPAHLLFDGDRATITDFTTASSSAPQVRLDADLAELLVTTTALVGADRAVAAMADQLGDDDLQAVLPVLQPAALSAGTRRHVDELKPVLADLRDRISTLTGREPPAAAELRRVTVANVATMALTFVGVAFILSMLTDVDWAELYEKLQSASWGWVLVAAVISLLPAFTDAVATLGGLGPQLPMAPLVVMNWAGKFIGIVMPSSTGQAAISIRFAQRQGIEPGAAISGGIVISFAGLLVQLLVIATGLALGVVELDLSFSFPTERLGLWIVVLGLIGVVLAVAVRSSMKLRRWFHDTVRPQIAEFRRGLRSIVEAPGRIGLLLAGNVGSQALFGLMLTAVLLAFGVDSDVFLLALLANTGASLFAGLMPVPGGVGVWEGTAAAILVAGGVDPTIATVSVLTHRVLTFYLPPIYGWFAFAWLRRRDYL